MDMGVRYMAIAHVWNDGEVDYVNVLDNAECETKTLDGAHVPQWVQERVALLRLCEINREEKGEHIGRKFTDHLLYLYLTYNEYKELIEIINQTRVQS